MKVVWTNRAFDHLLRIREHIEFTSSVYADQVLNRLIERSEQRTDFPRSGRTVPEYALDDVRELVTPPYRLIYRVSPDRVDVLAVVHVRQQLPGRPGDL